MKIFKIKILPSEISDKEFQCRTPVGLSVAFIHNVFMIMYIL